MRLIFTLFFYINATIAFATVGTASVLGNWSSTATWGASAVSGASQAITINTGITVTMDVAYTTTGSPCLQGICIEGGRINAEGHPGFILL